ncbi:MAG: adenylosuccinate lyase [Bacteroidota bacterium]
MSASELLPHINYDKAYRANRMNGALWVIEHPETFEELLHYSFGNDKELAHRAAWVLEFVFLEKPELLYPHLDIFFEKLPTVHKDSILRPCANICEKLAIAHYKKKDTVLGDAFTHAHKLQMTECCFDWMITPQKIACQARAMTALYYLGTEFDWIHAELKQIVAQNIHTGTAGYKARGRKVLEQISKFNTQ